MQVGHYHVVGAAGVGMSALAQALAAAGMTVTGSDRHLDQGDALPVIRALEAAGVVFHPQDGRAVRAGTCAVVLSTAIEPDNADVQAAQRLGVPLLHRSVALAQLAAGRRCIAVSGTCGKSTVTGMIGWVLEVAGLDPMVVNGAPVLNWATDGRVGNFRAGRSGLCVIEADESDRSLLNYAPDWGVITNASADHFGMEETLALFEAFAANVTGGLVSTLHEPGLLAEARLEAAPGGVRVAWNGLDLRVPLIGLHNAENALLAAVLCVRLGIDAGVIQQAFTSFRGIARRLELIGRVEGVSVVDDYAHNPAKLRAAWRSLTPHARRVIGIWRPHGFGPLRQMMEALEATFAEVLRPEDRLHILPVYDAGGTADRSVNADALVRRLHARGLPVQFASGPEGVPETVAREAAPGDLVVTMGARDPHLPDLARAILRALA